MKILKKIESLIHDFKKQTTKQQNEIDFDFNSFKEGSYFHTRLDSSACRIVKITENIIITEKAKPDKKTPDEIKESHKLRGPQGYCAPLSETHITSSLETEHTLKYVLTIEEFKNQYCNGFMREQIFNPKLHIYPVDLFVYAVYKKGNGFVYISKINGDLISYKTYDIINKTKITESIEHTKHILSFLEPPYQPISLN